jgi:signal transduction histidine kinase
LTEAISEIQASKKTGFTKEYVYKSSETNRILTIQAIPMRDKEILLLISDVTEKWDRQERLYLTDRLASVGEMASGVAHELNNPLTSVIGLSQLLIDEDLPEETKEDVKAIYSEAQRAAAIVRNLLTFARKHAPLRESTQINKVIEDVLLLRAYEHKVNNINVNTQFDPELPEITVDYFQMQQVFLNIVLNAENVMIEAHKHGTLTVNTEHVNSSVRISFTDDGPGIPSQNLTRIFDPFFTTKEVGKGTGLGLSICYGIVTNHGGKIYAQNNPNKGASFIVVLPIKN